MATIVVPGCPMCGGDLEAWEVEGLWACLADRLTWNQWTGKVRAIRRSP